VASANSSNSDRLCSDVNLYCTFCWVGVKNTHVATPHPAKQASKTLANNDKAKSPKSGGLISCSSCSK
jgi:hypothetical protein